MPVYRRELNALMSCSYSNGSFYYTHSHLLLMGIRHCRELINLDVQSDPSEAVKGQMSHWTFYMNHLQLRGRGMFGIDKQMCDYSNVMQFQVPERALKENNTQWQLQEKKSPFSFKWANHLTVFVGQDRSNGSLLSLYFCTVSFSLRLKDSLWVTILSVFFKTCHIAFIWLIVTSDHPLYYQWSRTSTVSSSTKKRLISTFSMTFETRFTLFINIFMNT